MHLYTLGMKKKTKISVKGTDLSAVTLQGHKEEENSQMAALSPKDAGTTRGCPG